MAIIGQLGLGMLILFAGLLFIMILFEITGTRKIAINKSGEKVESKKITEYHYKAFGVAIAILVIMVFMGAGGLKYLGFDAAVPSINYPLIFFIGIIVMIVWWMIQEGKKT
jgi:hypothetical protein